MASPSYHETAAPGAAGSLSPVALAAMAFACGGAVANIYYVQPILGVIGDEFSGAATLVSLLPTANQLGFAIGLLLLVPLGDGMSRQGLIFGQLAWLAASLAAAALAPGPGTLFAAMVAVGIGATVAQQIVPLAAELAPPARRGAVVGTVMSGLLSGILLGRVASGALAALAGWRVVFAAGVVLVAVIALLLRVTLPRSAPKPPLAYRHLLASLFALLVDLAPLRRAALAQAGLFGAFSAFWATLALHLAAPPFAMGSAAAGLFGVIGAAGVFAAPLAGRIADRRGPRPVILLGIGLTLLAWLILAAFNHLTVLIAGVVLLDLGVQMALIAHQSVIYALRPEARSRINTVFITVMFAGGTVGSAGGGLAWRLGGWGAVSVLAIVLVAATLFVHLLPTGTRGGSGP